MTFSISQLSPTTTVHTQESKRAGGRTTRHSRAATIIVHTFISSQAPLDAGKYTVPPEVGNLDRRPRTTPVNHGLLLESGRDVSPTSRVPSTKRKTFVACVGNHPSAEERLTRWRARLTDIRAQSVSRLGSKTTSPHPHLIGLPLPPFSSTPPRAG